MTEPSDKETCVICNIPCDGTGLCDAHKYDEMVSSGDCDQNGYCLDCGSATVHKTTCICLSVRAWPDGEQP